MKMCLLQDVINTGNSTSAEHFVDLLLPVLIDHLQMLEQIVDELLVKKKCERMVKAINVLTNILFVCLLAIYYSSNMICCKMLKEISILGHFGSFNDSTAVILLRTVIFKDLK